MRRVVAKITVVRDGVVRVYTAVVATYHLRMDPIREWAAHNHFIRKVYVIGHCGYFAAASLSIHGLHEILAGGLAIATVAFLILNVSEEA